MARQKNDGRGRLGGRKKGTPNKVPTGMRAMIAKWTTENFETVLLTELNNIDNPKDKCDMYLRLLKFCLPTLSSVELEAKVEEMSFKDELKQMAEEE